MLEKIFAPELSFLKFIVEHANIALDQVGCDSFHEVSIFSGERKRYVLLVVSRFVRWLVHVRVLPQVRRYLGF